MGMVMFIKSPWLWVGSLAGGLLMLALGTGVIDERTWFGPEWEWAEDPLQTLDQDKALVCVQVVNSPAGPLTLRTKNTAGELEARVFWDNQLGHCSTLQVTEVGQTWIKPQLDQLFLSEASLTSWQGGWQTHQLTPEPGGWLIR